jgi:hypothetical protein
MMLLGLWVIMVNIPNIVKCVVHGTQMGLWKVNWSIDRPSNGLNMTLEDSQASFDGTCDAYFQSINDASGASMDSGSQSDEDIYCE